MKTKNKLPEKSVKELERIRELLESSQKIVTVTRELLYENQQTLIDDILKTVADDGEFAYDGKNYKVTLEETKC